MSRIIRNDRARQLQGQRAGIISRGLAFAADIGIAFLVYTFLVAALTLLWDLLFSNKIAIPTPPGWFSALAIFWTLVIYLSIGWGTTGRTIGKQLLGLRVVRADAQPLAPGQGFSRAFLCAIFWTLVIYLTLGWASTGRTIGKQLLGLRVVRADAQPLRPRQAFGRAFLCAVFYPGILWVPFDRRCRSLQDMALKTAVVYDWIPEAARPRRFPKDTGTKAPTAPGAAPVSGQARP